MYKINFSRVKRILFVFLISSLSACAQHKATVSSVSNKKVTTSGFKAMQQDILYYVNQHRKSLGLPALQMNDAATTEATKHSADMADGTMDFGHDGFNDRMKNIKEKIGFLRASAENVAYGKIDAKEVMDMWLSSPGHKKNIDGNYSLTGIGVAKDNKGIIFFTQIFLRK